MSIRKWILALCFAFMGAACNGSSNAGTERADSVHAAALLVDLAQGRLRGTLADDVVAFLGVPYAAPPIGELRWRPPVPAPAWDGVREASAYGASCIQMVDPTGFGPWTHEYVVQGAVSEDCLFLNVWKPVVAAAAARLVLVWCGPALCADRGWQGDPA